MPPTGFATWGRKMGKTWSQFKNANNGAPDLTASVEVVDGTGKLRGNSATNSVVHKHWRLSLGGNGTHKEPKERERRHRKSEGNALSPDHHHRVPPLHGANLTKNNSRGDPNTHFPHDTATSSKSKTLTRSSRGLYRKPSSSEENLGALFLSKKDSCSGEAEYYVNAKGVSVRKCATLKAPKSKAVDRVESIKGMILSRTGRSPARCNNNNAPAPKRHESDAKDKKSHFHIRTEQRHLKNNNSPLFRSCSTSTLPGSYVAGEDPAMDLELDFSPNLRHHHHNYQNKVGGNKGKMLMLGASPCYYSSSTNTYSPSSSPIPTTTGSPTKKAVSLDNINIASMGGNDVTPTTPLSSAGNKKYGFPHGFVRSKLTVLPEEYQHPSKLLVSSVSSDSVHLKVANADNFSKQVDQEQNGKSKTSLLNNKSNSTTKLICRLREQSPMSKGEAVLLKTNLILKPFSTTLTPNKHHQGQRKSHRSRSNSPAGTGGSSSPTKFQVQNPDQVKAGVSRSVSLLMPKTSAKSGCNNSNSCEMLDAVQVQVPSSSSGSFCHDDSENGVSTKLRSGGVHGSKSHPNLEMMRQSESMNTNGMGANVNFSGEKLQNKEPTGEENKMVHETEGNGTGHEKDLILENSPNQSNSCHFSPSSCQSQNVSQPKTSPSSVGSGSGPTTQSSSGGSTYISSNESGYDSDSTKNVDEGNPANLNLNESGSESKIDSSGSEPSNSSSPLQSESAGTKSGSPLQLKLQLTHPDTLVDDEDHDKLKLGHNGNSSNLQRGWGDVNMIMEHNAELKITKSKTAVVRRKSDLANAIIARQSLISSTSPLHESHPYSKIHGGNGNANVDSYSYQQHRPFPQMQMSSSPTMAPPSSLGCIGESSCDPQSQSNSHFRTRKLGRVPCIPMESKEIFRICTSSSAQSSYLVDVDKDTFTSQTFTSGQSPLPPPPPQTVRKRFQLFHVTKELHEPLGIELQSSIGDGNGGGETMEHIVKDIHPGSAAER